MIFGETYTLSNGVTIPKLGLGTWFIPDEEQRGQSVRLLRSAIATSTLRRLMKMNAVWEKESVPADLPVRKCLLPQSWRRRSKIMRRR